MVLDLKKLESAASNEAILEPRKVFATLPKKDARFKFLHDVQAEVADQWFERRSEKDLVIKMNTGSGKTLVGLLLLQSSLNENKGPAVYVAPDKFLVAQVLTEAGDLGLQVTTNENDADFHAGRSILVINVYKLFNGRSVFGVGDQGQKTKIGTVLIDDAHACLATTRNQFTIRIPSTHPAYLSLLPNFKPELERQSRTTLLDVEAEDPQAVMLVPYWVWQSNQDQIAPILHEHRGSPALEWGWPLIAGVLEFCRCAIGGGDLEIAPRCLPVDVIPSFDQADRRIYMTATLADDSILITEFQAKPESVASPITPASAGDIGDRMILAPQEINPKITDEDLKAFAAEMAKTYNVVVIVPSMNRSEFWVDVANQILMSEKIWDGVSKLKEGHQGLTVLVNRYDGIDLPDNACRVLVIDGLPEVQNHLHRIDAIALDGTQIEISQQIQRIEQGMGRGVRSNDDYCVVILMGSRLVRRLHDPANRRRFTPGTLCQLDLSSEVAKQLKGQTLEQLKEAMNLCLTQNADWLSASKKAVVGAKYVKEVELNPLAIGQREAFDLIRGQQFKLAADKLQDAVNGCPDNKTKGWMQAQLAEVVHRIDPIKSQEILLSALGLNGRITKPLDGIAYAKLDAPNLDQATAVVKYLKPKFLEGNELILAINSVIDDLIFQPDTAPTFESAIKALGSYLGLGSQRPEADFGNGPDNLWAVGGQLYFVIECKNGATTDTISKHYSDQLSGSINWFHDTYGKTCNAVPIMIHPSHRFGNKAFPPDKTRIIDEQGLDKLRNAVRDFATAAGKENAFLDAAKIGGLLDHLGLTAKKFISEFSVPFKKEK